MESGPEEVTLPRSKAVQVVATELERAGLRRRTAVAIADAHRVQIEIWNENEDPRLATWSRRLGERLPQDLDWQDHLVAEPHLATLLAAVGRVEYLEAAKFDDDLFETAVWALSQYPEQPYLERVASSFPRHLARIHALRAWLLPNAADPFVFDRKRPGAAEYDLLLASILDEHVLRRPDLTLEAWGVLIEVGPNLRRRLEAEGDLREVLSEHIAEIRDYLGPDLERVEHLRDAPYLLDLAGIAKGLDLMRARGPEVAEILFERGLDPGLRERVARLLAHLPGESSLGLWAAARHSGDLQKLLDKTVPVEVAHAALRQVGEAPDPTGKLAYLASLGKAALEDECGMEPPGFVSFLPLYDVYSTARRIARGQEVSGLDFAFAAVDLVSIIPAVGGSVRLIKVGKNAASGAKAVTRRPIPMMRAGAKKLKDAAARSRQAFKNIRVTPEALKSLAVYSDDAWVMAELGSVMLEDAGHDIGEPLRQALLLRRLVNCGRKAHSLPLQKGGHVQYLFKTIDGGAWLWFTKEVATNMALTEALEGGVEAYGELKDLEPATLADLTPLWIRAFVGGGDESSEEK